MKIAFIGLKGLPAKFGGLQFDAEEIGQRLSKRGHQVYVYCRRWYTGNITKHKGMNLIVTDSIPSRYTDVITHTINSFFHIIFQDYDIVHLFSFGSYFIVPFLRLFGKKTVITFGGEPWNDISLNRLGRLITRFNYEIAARYSNAITSESLNLKGQTEKKFFRRIVLAPIGGDVKENIEPEIISKTYGLNPDKYILFLGRIEKVKRIDWIIRAFKKIKSDSLTLVIAGTGRDKKYVNELFKLAGNDRKIIFTGLVGGRLKEEILSNCSLFILPSVSEGMSSALVEAMGYGRICLTSDIPANKFLIEDSKTGFLFDTGDFDDLLLKMEKIINSQNKEDLGKIRNNAQQVIRDRLSWDRTVDIIEGVYRSLE